MPIIGMEFDAEGNVIKRGASSEDFKLWASEKIREDFNTILEYFGWDVREQPIKLEIKFIEHWIKYLYGTYGRAINAFSEYGEKKIRIGIPNNKKWWDEGGHKLCRNVLIHEMFHHKGMKHNDFYYKQGYYSNFDRDTFTPPWVDKIFGSG